MSRLTVFFMLQLGLAAYALAGQQAPDCLDNSGQAIPVIDAQVLQWETTTPNQTLERAHVSGSIVQIFPDHSGHSHFAIQIGPNSSDQLEVVYNQDFGSVPTPTVGDQVEACGDYITSTEQSGPYPASPCNAIIHWVHEDPHGKHPDGYLMINGVVYGDPVGGASQTPNQAVQPDQNGNDNVQPGYCSHRAHKRHEC